jgi:hypothetical protein
MTTLRERLDRCARDGALSTADLAEWFSLSYPTLKSYREGTIPNPARRQQIEQRLQWLETAVEKSPLLPVPLEVRAADRQSYIAGIKRAFQPNL